MDSQGLFRIHGFFVKYQNGQRVDDQEFWYAFGPALVSYLNEKKIQCSVPDVHKVDGLQDHVEQFLLVLKALDPSSLSLSTSAADLPNLDFIKICKNNGIKLGPRAKEETALKRVAAFLVGQIEDAADEAAGVGSDDDQDASGEEEEEAKPSSSKSQRDQQDDRTSKRDKIRKAHMKKILQDMKPTVFKDGKRSRKRSQANKKKHVESAKSTKTKRVRKKRGSSDGSGDSSDSDSTDDDSSTSSSTASSSSDASPSSSDASSTSSDSSSDSSSTSSSSPSSSSSSSETSSSDTDDERKMKKRARAIALLPADEQRRVTLRKIVKSFLLSIGVKSRKFKSFRRCFDRYCAKVKEVALFKRLGDDNLTLNNFRFLSEVVLSLAHDMKCLPRSEGFDMLICKIYALGVLISSGDNSVVKKIDKVVRQDKIDVVSSYCLDAAAGDVDLQGRSFGYVGRRFVGNGMPRGSTGFGRGGSFFMRRGRGGRVANNGGNNVNYKDHGSVAGQVDDKNGSNSSSRLNNGSGRQN